MSLTLLHIIPFLLVLSRLSGLFIFAPMLASSAIPLRARALFAAAFAVTMYPLVPPASGITHSGAGLDLFSLLPAVGSEVLLGLSIGLLAALPIFAVQLAGLLMGQQMGLGLAGVYNPAMETESDVLGEILMYLAMGIFIIAGGLEALFLAVARSFTRVPLGGFATAQVPFDHIVGLTASGLELALRIAAPVTCIILLETLASGILMKTIPQLNVLSIGFAIKILVGFSALIAGLAAIHQIIGDDVLSTLNRILAWSGSLPPPVPSP